MPTDVLDPSPSLLRSSTAKNVLDHGVKCDVRTVTDAEITQGTNRLGSSAAAWTSAHIGMRVQVVGAGAPFNNRGAWAPTTLYAFGDLVTYQGTTFVASSPFTSAAVYFDYGPLTTFAIPATARTLFASIVDVQGGVAILDTSASSTVAGTTCTFGTDDTDALVDVMGDGLVRLIFDAGRAVFLADPWIPNRTTLDWDLVTLKIPYPKSTDVAVARFLTADRTLQSRLVGQRSLGTPTIDMSEWTPVASNTIPRGFHIGNAESLELDGLDTIGMVGGTGTGNAIALGATQGGVTNPSAALPHKVAIGEVTQTGVRQKGSSAVQCTGGTHISIESAVTDGGVAMRFETDDDGVWVRHARCRFAQNTGATGITGAALYTSAHNSEITDVVVAQIAADGTADGWDISKTVGGAGLVEDCHVTYARVRGGGRIVTTSGNDQRFPNCTIDGGSVERALAAVANRKNQPGTPGTGLNFCPDMRFSNIDVTDCEGPGAMDDGRSNNDPVGTTEFMSCNFLRNAVQGIRVRGTKRVVLLGGASHDDPDLLVPITAQMFAANQYQGSLAGWSGDGGASAPSNDGAGHLTIISDGSQPYAGVKTATGLSGIVLQEGHYYLILADVAAGTAPAGGAGQIQAWKYAPSSGAFLGAIIGVAVTIPTGGTARPALAFQCPVGTRTIAALVFGYDPSASTNTPHHLTAGQTFTAANFVMQEIHGLPTQQVGVQVDAGCGAYLDAVDLAGNGTAPTAGGGTVLQAQYA